MIKSGKTPEQIIKSATKGNSGMDACFGLYDDYFDTYWEVVYMTWEIINKGSYVLYISRVIDLKVKIIFGNEEDAYYINYKGYNIVATMLIWEFGEDLDLASLYDVHFVEESPSDNHFIVSKKDKDKFLEEVYFFLIDNNIDSVLKEKYRVDW